MCAYGEPHLYQSGFAVTNKCRWGDMFSNQLFEMRFIQNNSIAPWV